MLRFNCVRLMIRGMAASKGLNMMNLGPKSESWLRELGVHSEEHIREAGVVELFLQVEEAGHRPSLNLLWSLEGALTETPWEWIDPERKEQLRAELDASRKHRSS